MIEIKLTDREKTISVLIFVKMSNQVNKELTDEMFVETTVSYLEYIGVKTNEEEVSTLLKEINSEVIEPTVRAMEEVLHHWNPEK